MRNPLMMMVELVFSGKIDGWTSKKAPMFLRIMLGTVLLVVYTALLFLLILVGVDTKRYSMLVVAFLVAASMVSLVFPWVRKKREA